MARLAPASASLRLMRSLFGSDSHLANCEAMKLSALVLPI